MSVPAGFAALAHPTTTGSVGQARYAVWGRRGPVCLLLPAADDLLGWPPTVIDELTSGGMKVVGIDAPAHVLADPTATAQVGLWVLDEIHERSATVVGVSQGGLAAQAMAAMAKGRVDGMVLVMSRLPTARDLQVPRELLGVLAPPPRAGAATTTEARHLDAVAVVANGLATPTDAARARAREAVEAGTDPVTALVGFAAGDDRPQPLPPAQHHLAHRTLVVHGHSDPVIPFDAGRELADYYGGDLLVVPAGHDLPWGAEPEIVDAVRRVAGIRPEPRAVRERSPGRRFLVRAGWVGGTVAVLLTIAIIAAATIRVPYYAIKPGSTRAVGQYITVPSDRRVEPDGEVLFVTVNVEGRLTFLGRLAAERNDNIDVVPEELITGGKSRPEYRAETAQEMVDSQMKAAVVALRSLCFAVKEQGTGARISLVTEGSPSSGHLRQGDVVVAVNGRPVAVADDLIASIRASKPGSSALVEVEPPEVGAARRTETIQLGSHPDDPNRAFLGVSFVTRQQKFDLPFPVTFDTGRVGGPSAGLAFAITVLDLLSEGELTGGRKVAVTGTIELDGRVGPVGGVEQKAITVGREDAALFLVPASEVDVARASAGPDVKVVPVNTFGEAVQALGANGGDISRIPNACPA